MARVPMSQLPDWNVVDEDKEIRGLRLQDEQGNTLGLIADLIVDTDAGYVDALLLDNGQEVLADDIEIGRGIVFLRRPVVPQEPARQPAIERVDALRVPVVEETLHVGKREVEGGGVRVTTQVENVPVREQVTVHEESIGLQRVPLHRPVEEGDVEGAFEERTFEVRAHAEEIDIGKQLFVVEEIRINKDVAERTETVEESVRRTRVDIEELPGQTLPSEPGQADLR